MKLSSRLCATGLVWLFTWGVPTVFYATGYKAGRDGSTLDPVGVWTIIFLVITFGLLCLSLGAWLKEHWD